MSFENSHFPLLVTLDWTCQQALETCIEVVLSTLTFTHMFLSQVQFVLFSFALLNLKPVKQNLFFSKQSIFPKEESEWRIVNIVIHKGKGHSDKQMSHGETILLPFTLGLVNDCYLTASITRTNPSLGVMPLACPINLTIVCFPAEQLCFLCCTAEIFWQSCENVFVHWTMQLW